MNINWHFLFILEESLAETKYLTGRQCVETYRSCRYVSWMHCYKDKKGIFFGWQSSKRSPAELTAKVEERFKRGFNTNKTWICLKEHVKSFNSNWEINFTIFTKISEAKKWLAHEARKTKPVSVYILVSLFFIESIAVLVFYSCRQSEIA